MRNFRFVPLMIVVAAVFAVVTLANNQPVLAQGENLLANPSFEGAYSSFIPQTQQHQEACEVGVCTTAQMPAGWFPWWVSQTADDEPWQNRMPEWKPVCPFSPCPYTDRVHSGEQAMQYFTFHSTHTAGAWQRVSVPPNANLRFSVWGQAWSSATDKVPSDFPTVVNMRIGIDPTGGTNPFSGSIVWSGFANPYDNYQQFTIDATAQGDVVTVFMWSQPQEARKHNDIYWDDAALVVGGGGGAAPVVAPAGGGAPAPAAPAPGVRSAPAGPTPTPNADGVIEVEVFPGDTMWSIAARAGISLDEFLELNNLGRDDFISAGQMVILGYGDPSAAGDVAAAADEAAEEDAAAAEGTEALAVAADAEAEEEAAEEDAAVEEDAAEESEAVEEAPVAAVEAEPEAVGGSICLRAFNDNNQDGVYDSGEELKQAVAFTIADGQSVVSNYVTDGVSEPYCIEGLPVGNYRVSRSFAPNEVATNAGDWAISLADGSVMNVDFGSRIDESAAVAAEEAALTTGDVANEASLAEAAELSEAGEGISSWVVIVIVILAAVLLIGVTLVVLSARRVA